MCSGFKIHHPTQSVTITHYIIPFTQSVVIPDTWYTFVSRTSHFLSYNPFTLTDVYGTFHTKGRTIPFFKSRVE